MNSGNDKGPLCRVCGSAIPAGAPGGMCPPCLLRQGLSEIAAGYAAASPAFEPPSLSVMKARFPQLEILELAGRGGMGAVYKARQPRLNRMVAVKVLPVDPAAHPESSQRFVREAQALARLSHPNIVTIHDFGEEEDFCYLIMEFVEGETLKDLISSRRLTPRQAVEIAVVVCDALHYAHGCGIVHRDIKPGNILIEKSGRVKIADFGLAKALAPESGGRELTLSGDSMGTPYYAAPEQRSRAGAVDHRADLYSVGVILYEMLTGELPAGSFDPVSVKAGVDPRLDDIVLRALKTDPAGRYQDAAGLKSDLDAVLKRGVVPAAPALSRSSNAAKAAAALLFIGAVFLTLWSVRRGHTPAIPPDAVEFGDHCYKVYYENVSWNEARVRCERMGGRLAVVHSAAEDEFLASISRSHVWLGASDEGQKGRWTWLDGSAMSYSNWDIGEPNNAPDPKTGDGESYLMISKYGKWNDLSGRSEIIMGFICEWDGGLPRGPRRISGAADLHAALRAANAEYSGKAEVEVAKGAIVGVSLLHSGVTNVCPLRGLPLVSVDLSWTEVEDLSPLEKMPLVKLALAHSRVEDVSPLAGMPLHDLRIDGTRIRDLSPLRGMPLTYLDISHSRVTDLTPLAGMKLQELHMNCAKVTDLSPLAGMPLRKIGLLDVPASDLSPLEKCAELEFVVAPPGIRNFDCLRRLPKLKLLNSQPVLDFWREYDRATNRNAVVPE